MPDIEWTQTDRRYERDVPPFILAQTSPLWPTYAKVEGGVVYIGRETDA